MKSKITRGILWLILLTIFSNTLFDGVALAASTNTILEVTYLSQLTADQWVAQWYEHMNKPNPITTSMNCGPATIVMLESYFKQTIPTPERILEVDEFIYDSLNLFQGENAKTYTRPPVGFEYCGPAEGVNTADMQIILQEFMGFENVQLEVGQTVQDIKDLIDQGFPVVIPVNRIYAQKSNVNVYHFTLVRGYEDERFYCNDTGKPDAIGSQANYTFEELEQIWQPGNRILSVQSFIDNTSEIVVTKAITE